MKYILIKVNEHSSIEFKNPPFYILALSKIIDFLIKKDHISETAIKNCKYWLLEFEYNSWNYTYEVKREIGLDNNKRPIIKFPNFQNKYGFWMNEDLDYQYFKNNFKNEKISKRYFSDIWNSI